MDIPITSYWGARLTLHQSPNKAARGLKTMAIRKAFLMVLKPGQQDEYERRHQSIWPELEQVLNEHGVSNYSIFLNRATDQLFAYAEIESEEAWQQTAETEACRRWWAYMKDLMLTTADNKPAMIALDEVFHLD